MTTGPSFDRAALGDDAVRTVREMLLGSGCTVDELDQAEREGTLPLLAVERLIVPEAAAYDLATVSERTGLDADEVRHLWRSLGYAVPRPDEVAFTDADVDILAEVGHLMAADVASADLVLQMSRVIGSSMARIASAQVDAISAGVGGAPRTGLVGADLTDEQIVVSASALLPIVPSVLAAAWRRHLQAAVRRRLSIAETGQAQFGVVGFADLVGFTALSQRVDDDALAAIVDQFEQLAFDVVTAHGGRVVKMIGDEVMFTVDSADAAAEIGLALAEGTRGADELSEVRVGLAQGPLLEREGDLYGAVVNLASRITVIAFPGSRHRARAGSPSAAEPCARPSGTGSSPATRARPGRGGEAGQHGGAEQHGAHAGTGEQRRRQPVAGRDGGVHDRGGRGEHPPALAGRSLPLEGRQGVHQDERGPACATLAAGRAPERWMHDGERNAAVDRVGTEPRPALRRIGRHPIRVAARTAGLHPGPCATTSVGVCSGRARTAGGMRLYSDDDIARAKRLGEIIAAGAPLAAARRIVRREDLLRMAMERIQELDDQNRRLSQRLQQRHAGS